MNSYAIKAYIYQTMFFKGVIKSQAISPSTVQKLMLDDGQNASVDIIRELMDDICEAGDLEVVAGDAAMIIYKVV